MRRTHGLAPSLPSDAFKFCFNGMSEEAVRYKYYSVGIRPPSVEAQHRVTNKTKKTPTFMGAQTTLFNLASRGHALPPPPVDEGSDMEEEDGDDEMFGGDIDTQISQMWHQFLVDLAMKTPTPQGGGDSYFTLNASARSNVKEEVYMNLTLSDTWIKVYWKLATVEQRQSSFRNLFPEQGHEVNSKVQNYLQCTYYRKWKEICATTNSVTVQAIREQIEKKFLALNWVPQATRDRIWNTQKKLSGYQKFPSDLAGPAPHILCKRMPTWRTIRDADEREGSVMNT